MKSQNAIEATTLKNLLGLMCFNESISDLRFLYKEIIHFVDIDTFTKEDQTSLYFFDEMTDLLSELNLLYGSSPNADDLQLKDRGLIIIEKIRDSASGDLIKYLENISDLAVFHTDFDRYCEETRNALYSLKNIKEALTPLINESFPSEEIKMLKQQLKQSHERINELESKLKK
jgi:hypothetical protein